MFLSYQSFDLKSGFASNSQSANPISHFWVKLNVISKKMQESDEVRDCLNRVNIIICGIGLCRNKIRIRYDSTVSRGRRRINIIICAIGLKESVQTIMFRETWTPSPGDLQFLVEWALMGEKLGIDPRPG
jgi:hypothetical protein